MGAKWTFERSEQTVSALGTFFLCMALHPEVQYKAQEEIDRVVGSDRLPVFEDRRALPYVEAIYREVMRWQPVLPLGVSHATTEDDMYNGYFIPKGELFISIARSYLIHLSRSNSHRQCLVCSAVSPSYEIS